MVFSFWKRQDALDETLVQYGMPPKAQEQVPTPCRSRAGGSGVGLSSSGARLGDLNEELDRLTAREDVLIQQLTEWDLLELDAHEANVTPRDEVPSDADRPGELGILKSELELVRASIGLTASRCSSMSTEAGSPLSAQQQHGAVASEAEFDSHACAAMIKSAKSESRTDHGVIDVVGNLLMASPLGRELADSLSRSSAGMAVRMASRHDEDPAGVELPTSPPVPNGLGPGAHVKSKPRPVRRNKPDSDQNPPRKCKPAPAPASRILAKELEYWLPQSSSLPSPSPGSRRAVERGRLTDRSRSCREPRADAHEATSAATKPVVRHRQQRRTRSTAAHAPGKEIVKPDPGTGRAADRSRSPSRTFGNNGVPLTTAQSASAHAQVVPEADFKAHSKAHSKALRLSAQPAGLYTLTENLHAEGPADLRQTREERETYADASAD